MLPIAPHGDDGCARFVDNDCRADQSIHLVAITLWYIPAHQEIEDGIGGMIAATMVQNVADVFW